MKRRLQIMFQAAWKRGIRTLVLGAWGCGAFHIEPYMVAAILHEVLCGENWESCFDQIVFAVLGAEDAPNVTAFHSVFKTELTMVDMGGHGPNYI